MDPHTHRLYGITYCSVGEEKNFPSTLLGSWLTHRHNKRMTGRGKVFLYIRKRQAQANNNSKWL